MFNTHYKQYTIPELYNPKQPRKVEEDEDERNVDYST
jgi:hypothetical protein